MTEADVMDQIRAEIAHRGSQKMLAEAWGFSNSYLSDVLHGRRTLGPTILAAMGLERVIERVVTYREKASV